jgi:hypothetical protein
VPPDVLNSWRRTHDHWRFKGSTIRGVLDAKRMTGQATTALGNVITNMALHARLTTKHSQTNSLILMLGDDFLMTTDVKPDLVDHSHYTKNFFNIVCTPFSSKSANTFCRMIVSRNPLGTFSLHPDYIRLSERYEVTNGVHETNATTLDTRNMSYLHMISATPEAKALNKGKNWNLDLRNWYDYRQSISGTATIYNTTEEHVLHKLKLLTNMIDKSELTQHNFVGFAEYTTKPRPSGPWNPKPNISLRS